MFNTCKHSAFRQGRTTFVAVLEGDEARAKTSTDTNPVSSTLEHDEEKTGPAHEDGERFRCNASLSDSAGVGRCIADQTPWLDEVFFLARTMRRWLVLTLDPYREKWAVGGSSHASAG